jgi:hypothetical protein
MIEPDVSQTGPVHSYSVSRGVQFSPTAEAFVRDAVLRSPVSVGVFRLTALFRRLAK